MCVDGEGMPKYGNPFDKGRLFVLFHIVFPKDGSLSSQSVAYLKKALPAPLDHPVVGADAEALKKLAEKNESVRELLGHEAEEAFLTRVEGGMDDFGRGAGATAATRRTRTTTTGAGGWAESRGARSGDHLGGFDGSVGVSELTLGATA